MDGRRMRAAHPRWAPADPGVSMPPARAPAVDGLPPGTVVEADRARAAVCERNKVARALRMRFSEPLGLEMEGPDTLAVHLGASHMLHLRFAFPPPAAVGSPPAPPQLWPLMELWLEIGGRRLTSDLWGYPTNEPRTFGRAVASVPRPRSYVSIAFGELGRLRGIMDDRWQSGVPTPSTWGQVRETLVLQMHGEELGRSILATDDDGVFDEPVVVD